MNFGLYLYQIKTVGVHISTRNGRVSPMCRLPKFLSCAILTCFYNIINSYELHIKCNIPVNGPFKIEEEVQPKYIFGV